MSEQGIAIITGIAGGLARMVGAALAERGFQVVGVDYRKVSDPPDFALQIYQANYNKTLIEDIFRRHRPTHVLHLGRVGNLKEQAGKRFDLNVLGSRKVMDLSLKYGARRLVVLSTFHIYGAHPHNHIPIYEDEPLRAGTEFPQIADAIQFDNQAVTWIYRHRDLPTVLLRPCHIVGPNINNTISRFLRLPVIPVPMGFSPMTQFIHEKDIVAAIVAATVGEAPGVFNVAGKSPIPWLEAVSLTGARVVPVPSSLAALALRASTRVSSAFPPYMVNFFKFPCVISDAAFRKAFDWAPRVPERETIVSTVRGY